MDLAKVRLISDQQTTIIFISAMQIADGNGKGWRKKKIVSKNKVISDRHHNVLQKAHVQEY